MVKYFLENRVTTTVLLSLLILLGLISLNQLRIELFPKISIPTITVVTQYQNASIEEVELLVSKPIEEVVASAEGVDDVYSETMEGMSIVRIRLKWGSEVDLAAIAIREKLDLVKGALPIDVKKPIVLKFDPNDAPILRIVAKNKNLDFKLLRNFIKKNIVPLIEKANGVATISLSGGHERRILVEVDASRLRSYGLSTNHIVGQIDANNINIPSGNLIVGEEEILIRSVGAFQNVEEINNLIIKTTESQAPVYLSNIAKVIDSFKEQTSACKINEENCVLIDIRKEAGKNTVAVSSEVSELIQEINHRFSNELELEIIEDKSRIITSSVADVATSIILSISLCFLILTIFTGSWPDAILVTLSIPTSILIVFVIMHFLDQSINLMSLGGIAVGVGLMVDSSIVVLESIHKEKKDGKETFIAISEGASKIAFALVISNITSIVVFLPNLYLKGLEGIIFKDFAISVCICLAASLIVSLVFLPFFNLKFSMKTDQDSKISRYSKKLTNQLEDFYISKLALLNKTPKVPIYFGILSLVIAFGLAFLIPVSLMPNVERKELTVKLSLPLGTRLITTVALVEKIESLAAAVDPEIVALSKVGFEERELLLFPTTDFGLNRSEIYLRFPGYSSKQKFLEQLQSEVLLKENIKVKFSGDGDLLAEVLPYSFQQVNFEVSGSNFDSIRKSVTGAKSILSSSLGWTDVITSFDEELSDIRIKFDRARMASFGISSSSVGDSIRVLLKGDETNFYRIKDEEVPILVRSSESGRRGVNNLTDLNIQIAEDKSIRLQDFANLIFAQSPRIVNRHNGKRVGYLSKDIEGKSLSSTYGDAVSVLKLDEFDENGNFLDFGENKKLLDGSVSGLGIALLFSIILVYMTLAAAMESYLLPLVILFSIFLSAFGICTSLLIFGESINMMSILGSILLAGIVVNNAILIVEFYRDERKSFQNIDELILVGARTRLIPILSTTITSLLGLVPLLVAMGESSSQRSLAAAIFGGLLFSTIVSLFFVPAVCKILIEKGLMEK
ncbi:efflux RND transporter permease subunit [Leptospira idonii]|uniref:Efflux RND transporter permease subunit n=1 Tax=Leptospira idonii TaxID=1193500 RepID=A0A4R9LZJ2_9LEPT|nr:efflux RND transporter permease subunit [Leptospira idonii]TGN19790.1 efflux RND transporter permease subunit [Leptospira idonii]